MTENAGSKTCSVFIAFSIDICRIVITESARMLDINIVPVVMDLVPELPGEFFSDPRQ